VAETDAERDLAQAVGLFHELRLSEAQAAADKIVAAEPNLPGGWYLHGQLALVQGKISAAREDLQKAADLSSGGLNATGEALLALVDRYARTAQQAPGGKLPAQDTLGLLRDLQGREEYFAFVSAQQETRDLLMQSIRSALALDNGAKFADAAHVAISQENEEVVLTLKDIPSDIDLSSIKQFPIFNALHIENTAIGNLAPFAGMQLSRVEIIGSPIANLDVLKGMPLSSLTLKDTGVQDLTPLRDAPLRSLTLDRVPFPPAELLQRWPLGTLSIADEPLPDHFVVPKSVRSLGLARTGLGDLQLVASSSLDSLDVSGNPDLSSLEPLRTMNTLHHLDISDTGVSSLLPLSYLNLESLSLRKTFVGQIACLKYMPLQELDLRGCTILDVDKLTKLPPKFFPPGSP
jgi:tetratricopeptide (TPR) repeat protein